MDTFTAENERNLRDEARHAGIERFVVGAIVRRSTDRSRILVLERTDDDFMGGIEELPSGKVEQNERLLDALKRELEEETGLTSFTVKSYLWSFDYLSGSGRLTRQWNFVVEVEDAPVKVNPAEHSNYRWLPLNELGHSRLTPNIIESLGELKAELR